MDAKEKIEKAYYTSIRRDAIRLNTYVVAFARKAIPESRGWNNDPNHAPSPFEIYVEIGEGEPNVQWRSQPSDPDASLEDFEDAAIRRAIEEHQKQDKP